MVDIHHHLLPGVDDGSKSMEQSVAMVESAFDDGITHIVATPHANDRYTFDRPAYEDLLQQIRDALPPDVAAGMTLGLGCDFHLNWENTEDARTHKRRYTINESEYLLIELPDVGIPSRIDEVLYQLRLDGMTPILTHPERNLTLQRQPQKLREWVASGLLLQVTAGSVLGHFGPAAESMAWQLLKQQWVQFLATDAHNLDRRPPHMRAAFDLLTERLGEDTAAHLCRENPLAVFEGRTLPPAPALIGISPKPTESDDETPLPLWKRLLRRH